MGVSVKSVFFLKAIHRWVILCNRCEGLTLRFVFFDRCGLVLCHKHSFTSVVLLLFIAF